MSRHVVRARAGESRANLYDEITDKIITELGRAACPGSSLERRRRGQPLAMPKNASTARQYSGTNVLILWGAVIEHGFTGQSWLTFRQALSLGGHVRKASAAQLSSMPTASFPTMKRARGGERRGSPSDFVPEAVHGSGRAYIRRASACETDALLCIQSSCGRRREFRSPSDWS